MAKRASRLTASDDEVQSLLERYHCPVPLHAVPRRFLGNIASPASVPLPRDGSRGRQEVGPCVRPLGQWARQGRGGVSRGA